MSSRCKRVIPMAAAASTTLSFAACGDSQSSASPKEKLAQEVEQFAKAYCETYMRCDAKSFSQEFDNLAGCIQYYKGYFTEYYASDASLASAPDKDACREANAALLKCNAKGMSNLSCDDFNSYYYSDATDPWEQSTCGAEDAAARTKCGPRYSGS